MLSFDPRKRPSAKECLAHELFNDVRSKKLEKTSKNQILLKLDHHDAYDYVKDVDQLYTHKDYIKMILKEVKKL